MARRHTTATTVTVDLQRTPLDDRHRSLGAKMSAFAGWSMPIEYAGVLAEHRAVREAVGMFDLTHLGKIDVSGPAAFDWLQRVVTNDLTRVEIGRAQYNLVLNEDGGIVDDLIVYRPTEDGWLVVPNAANTRDILAAMTDGAPSDAVVEHRPDLVTIAVQGPRSPELVAGLFAEAESLGYMACVEIARDDATFVIARSGYTGEVGYEIFAPDVAAETIWQDLIDRGGRLGLVPCGLGARDTLRLEMGYPLHGNDISQERTPLEAGLSWAVAFDKGEFRGREALVRRKEQGIDERLRGLRMVDRLIPRAHYPVFAGQERVGETTSGSFSPTLRVGIGLAYLSSDVSPGDRVEVDVRGRRGVAEVVKPPFVDSSPK